MRNACGSVTSSHAVGGRFRVTREGLLFCKTSCSNLSQRHTEHHAKHHRPGALGGLKWFKTTHFSIDICSNLVKSDIFYVPSQDETREFLYKEYKKAGEPYCNWEIKPTDGGQNYWKWVLCTFKDNLEELYGCTFEDKGAIPSDWLEITKDMAIQSLKVTPF